MDYELIDRLLTTFLATPQAARSVEQVEVIAQVMCNAAGADNVLATTEQREHVKAHEAVTELATDLGALSHYTYLNIKNSGALRISSLILLNGTEHICADGITAHHVIEQLKQKATVFTAATPQ